jgi:Cu-Zn family superoxide dismutase
MRKTATIVSSGLLAVTCLSASAIAADGKAMSGATHLDLIGADGKNVGMAMLEQTPAGVLITVEASGLTPGEHAFHVHEKGLCDAGQDFSTAGGHFAGHTKVHGFKDAKGPHAGDMPNLFVGADGKVRAQVLNRAVTLGKGDGAMADADGSALVIHGGADDYVSQPAGNAGSRVACAVIAAPTIK